MVVGEYQSKCLRPGDVFVIVGRPIQGEPSPQAPVSGSRSRAGEPELWEPGNEDASTVLPQGTLLPSLLVKKAALGPQ